MSVFRAAANAYWDDAIQVMVCEQNSEGRITHHAQHVEFKMIERNALVISTPTFAFTNDEARNLMTALWEAGVRPAEYKDSRAEVRRMEAHIDDLRKVAFK